ncbi:fatty acid desaturase family protein [Clostridium intestinale]|nr:acyl-CoA desaturase [Clostridium intestinale]
MKDLHNMSWYAKQIHPKLDKDIFKPAPTRLIGGLIYLIVVAIGMSVVVLFDINTIGKLAIALILGFSFGSMGFLGHEILHGTVVRNKWLRNFLGGIAFLPLSVGPRLWVKWHNLNHHAHTQDDEKDPDAWMSLESFNKRGFIKLVYKLPLWFRSLFSFTALSISFTLHSVRMFFVYFKELVEEKSISTWFQFIFPWTFWFGLLAIVGFEKWVYIYLIPVLIGNLIVMGYISTNHRLNPLVPVNDPLANSLTVTVPKWLDVLHFNFSYHTEHHLFPGINPKHYPIIKAHILELWPDKYHEMPLFAALKALWKTPRIYYKDEELVDPHKKTLYKSLANGLKSNNIKPYKLAKDN